MAGQAPTVTIEPPSAGEGQLPLDVGFFNDLRLLNNQLAEFGIRNLARVNKYLDLLDNVMDTTKDERIKVMGTSVAVNALKACLAALKAEVAKGITNTGPVFIDARGNAALVEEFRKQMTVDERRGLLAKIEAEAGGNGHNGNGKH